MPPKFIAHLFPFFYSFFIHISNELTELVIQCIFLQKQLKVFSLFLFLNDVRVLQHPKHILWLVFATRYYSTIIHPKSWCPTVWLLQEIFLCKYFHLRNGLFQYNDTNLRSGISNIFSFTNKNFFLHSFISNNIIETQRETNQRLFLNNLKILH